MNPSTLNNQLTLYPEKELTTTDITLDHLKINSFNDVKYISTKSSNYFEEALTSEEQSKVKQFIKSIYTPSLNVNIYKIYLSYMTLNEEQRYIFHRIHNKISKSYDKDLYNKFGEYVCAYGSVNSLNANPGTGKTLLSAIIAVTSRKSCGYIVYTNNLEVQLSDVRGVESYTCCKFLMKSLQMKYYQVLSLWSNIEKGEIDCDKNKSDSSDQDYSTVSQNGAVLGKRERLTSTGNSLYYNLTYNLLKLLDRFRFIFEIDTLILDEYTVVSPWQIILFYCIGHKFKIHVLFTGDQNQQNRINKPALHRQSNYTLLSALCDEQFNLLTNMRQKRDMNYVNKMKTITDLLLLRANGNDIYLDFDLKYKIYTMFKSNFFLVENFSALYMAQYHQDLKKRISRTIDYLNLKKIPYFRAMFCKKQNTKYTPLSINEENVAAHKFHHFLLLIRGACYLYTDPSSLEKRIVKFIGSKPNGTIMVRDMSSKRFIELSRTPINESFVHPDQIVLLKQLSEGSGLYQFPLKFYALTYHVAQGLTISVDALELNIDGQTLNSIYVGLTRIQSEEQLRKIHSFDLLNFMLTDYFNDEYYYKICSATSKLIAHKLYLWHLNANESNKNDYKNLIDKNKFKTVDISKFRARSTKANIKVLKNNFELQTLNEIEISKHENKTTELLELCKFLQKNKHIIFKLTSEEFKDKFRYMLNDNDNNDKGHYKRMKKNEELL